jgi:leucyl/phenylalanyl-tRNA--protein transferase
MDPEHLHVSRSMRRFLRTTSFELRFDTHFADVMRACASEREEGTWILPEMIEAYVALHQQGEAHSVEVWDGAQLVGGLYGVQRGALFAAESMFHRATNASKLALIAAIHSLFAGGIRVFDVQFVTSHLASLGAYTVPRREYLARVRAATTQSVSLSGLKLSCPVL